MTAERAMKFSAFNGIVIGSYKNVIPVILDHRDGIGRAHGHPEACVALFSVSSKRARETKCRAPTRIADPAEQHLSGGNLTAIRYPPRLFRDMSILYQLMSLLYQGLE